MPSRRCCIVRVTQCNQCSVQVGVARVGMIRVHAKNGCTKGTIYPKVAIPTNTLPCGVGRSLYAVDEGVSAAYGVAAMSFWCMPLRSNVIVNPDFSARVGSSGGVVMGDRVRECG